MEAKDYIAAIREHGKLTQAQIAESVGTQQATISKIERGDVKDVMSVTYRKLKELHDSIVSPAVPPSNSTDLQAAG